jgi:hypothetical protein
VFAGLYHLAPEVLDAVKILKPETIIKWPRAGFRAWWRWKSRPRGGRPRTPDEVRQLIREMSVANPLLGASRIPGELLKLSMDVGQTTVAKYMAKRRRPPSQGWRTFVHDHADAIASIDMFVVGLLYGLLILRQSRRELLWLGCDGPSQCGMACPSADRGLRLGRASTPSNKTAASSLAPGICALPRSDLSFATPRIRSPQAPDKFSRSCRFQANDMIVGWLGSLFAKRLRL